MVEEPAQRQIALAQELPDPLLRVQLGAVGRQRQRRYVAGPAQVLGRVPAGAVEHEDGVRPRRDMSAQLRQEQGHRRRVAARQDQRAAEVAARAHRAEEIDGLVAVRARRTRARAGLGPDPGQRALLPDPHLIREPDFDRRARRQARADLSHPGGEVCWKAACAAGSLFGCRGRGSTQARPRRWASW